MSRGPRLEEFRVAIQAGLGALEAQTAAMGRAQVGRLKPAERWHVRTAVDGLARRIVAWQELAGPELAARLEAIAGQVRELQSGRRRA